ncbi:TPA: hypothetical protein ACJMKJ_005179 [Bacillus wiedmannii]
MIFIKLQADGINYESINYAPFDAKFGLGKTKEQLQTEGILVETLPEPEMKPGKYAVLKYNPNNKEFYYTYEDIPVSEEQKELNTMKQQQTLMQSALDEMIIQNPTPDELAELKKRLTLMQKAIDDLIFANAAATLEGGVK